MKRKTKPLTEREKTRIRTAREVDGMTIQALAKKFHRSMTTISAICSGSSLTENQRKVQAANEALMKDVVPLQDMVKEFVKHVRDTHPEVGEINVNLKITREERLQFK